MSCRFRWLKPWALVCLALMLASGQAMGAIYMKIDGVAGEVVDGRFAGWSELVGVAQQVVRPDDSVVPPLPAVPTFTWVVSKPIDMLSPLLVKRCGDGVSLPRVVLAYSDGGAAFYRVVLEDVLVSSVHLSSGLVAGAAPREQVSFSFKKVTWSWLEVGDGGQIEGGSTAAFDLATNSGAQKPRPPFRAEVQSDAEPGTMRLRCPVERGHHYRLAMTGDLKGTWRTVVEFTADSDGVVEQVVRNVSPVAFLRFEEIE